jgi:hypothetical protein
MNAGTPLAVRASIGVSGLSGNDGLILINSDDPIAAGHELAALLVDHDRLSVCREAAVQCANERLWFVRAARPAIEIMASY